MFVEQLAMALPLRMLVPMAIYVLIYLFKR